MKKLLPLVFALFTSCLATAQVILGTSPYTQDFNSIGTALPSGISVRTGATATALGTLQAYTSSGTTTAWNNTSGAFKNFASATDLTSGATSATQTSATNRSLGVRQTGSLGDPGAAFVIQLGNTTGLKDFKLSFKLQSLDITSPRQTTWRIDYGLGANPANFTVAPAVGTLTTGGSTFASNTITVDFGSNLNNQPSDVWIRIVAIAASTGSGNRASSAIDDLSLTYASGTVPTPTLSVNPSAIAFGSQAIGTIGIQSYTLTYANLDGSNVALNTLSPFAISKTAAGPFSASISYTAAELSNSPLVVYTQFSPSAVGNSSGTIIHTGGGVAGAVNVSLTGTGVSLAPVAANDFFTGVFGDVITGTVATNDSDPQALALTYSKLSDPQAGQLTFNTDGTFSYQSTEGSASPQLFTYRVSNTQGFSAEAIVTITLAEKSKLFISQYYEGTSVNKWIELTNPTSAPVNTASPQLKLGLYSISGDGGSIVISGNPSQVVNLNVIIPAKSSVLIGNTGNGTEVPYLTASSAVQTSNTVINFNGNDGVAILDASNAILDAFGTGINAKDVSYVRNQNATVPSASFVSADWTRTSLATVQNAVDLDDPDRLGVHVQPELPPCSTPASQPSALVFNSVGTKSITLSFTASADASEYLIVRSINNSLSEVPLDGTAYNAGSSLGGGVVAGKIVSTTFTDSNLASGSTFYYFIFAFKNSSCDGGPKYLTVNPLSGSQATIALPVCAIPTAQPTGFQISFSNYNVIQGTFIPAGNVDEFLVVMSRDSLLTYVPVDRVVYNVGDSIGGGIVIKRGVQGTFNRSSLLPDTDYFFHVFSVNSNCSNGPVYLTSSPLTGKQRTSVFDSNTLHFYFGNLHSHSSYSDGNKDDTSKKPEDDYAFAKNSRNMDFLGLSEHNHTQAGMRLANWEPGLRAARNATTSDFVALHGMEWGVISGGGHVIVYGIDSLIGWEPGEYQIYVPKNTYTGTSGLFNIINRHGLNAIATLAHPNSSDFNNIAANYNPPADDAIVGTALASGPAFSTNVTYSDPASSMNYLNYYNRMLAQGYHLGATIDHDNHNMTFGRHTRARLVVLAPALTENDLLDAMKKMRFYASEDSAARVTYTINNQPVGSVFSGNGMPRISVTASTTSPVTSISILKGIPGSGITPAQLVSNSSGTLSFTDSTLTHLTTGYYYADIVEADGSRIITSPIWYTRNDSLKSEQVITFHPLSAKTYGDADFNPGATSTNASLPVIYSSSDTTVASIVNNQVHIRKAGTVMITASQPGNALFKPAVPKTQTLLIAPLAIAASVESKVKEYGSADPQLTYTYQPALVAGDVFSGALTRQPGEDAGIYRISKGTLSLSSNYTLTVDTSTLTIGAKALLVKADRKTKIYGTPNPTLTATLYGFVTGEDSTVLTSVPVLSTTATQNSPAGIYPITVQGASAKNYSISYAFDSLTIHPASQVILFPPLAAKTYGDADFVLSASGGGSGNPITYTSSDSTVATIVNQQVHIVGAGTTTITAAQAGNGNYTAALNAAQSLVIQKAIATITVSNLSQTFDGFPKPVTVTTVPSGLTGITLLYDGSPSAPSAAGTYSVTATLLNANYTAAPASALLTIVQPHDLQVQYRNADASLTNNEGKPHLKIVNTGTTPVPYQQLTARYWITPENFTGSLSTWIDYAQLGNGKVIMKYVSLTDPKVNALGYIEYSFAASAGSLTAGANSGEIQSRYANTDWSVFNEANDYSVKTTTSYLNNPAITLYRNGVLIWGTEPLAETAAVKLKVFAEAKSAVNSNTISTYVDIRNEGNVSVDYKDITARYWFTSEGTSKLNFWLDYAKIGNSAVSGNFFTLNPSKTNADAYLELKVKPANTTFYPLTSTGNIQYRVSKSDWSNFNQQNDHSYQVGAMSENARITVYYKGQLVFGTEPAGINTAARTAGTASASENSSNEPEASDAIVYPNPASGLFTVQLNDQQAGRVAITIFDSIGKPVDSYTGEKGAGLFRKDYDLKLTQGIYYILIRRTDRVDYKTIVIN